MGDHGLLKEILHMPAIGTTHMSSFQHLSTVAIYQSNFALYTLEHPDFPELIAYYLQINASKFVFCWGSCQLIKKFNPDTM